jgi:DNA invertase Pin-like site-specific DNA recombinase
MKPVSRAATAPLRAVLYLRQSTYREESISLELQEAAGRAHAEKHGYVVVDVLADPGISGRTWKRPAVQRVMEMLEGGEAEVVVLWRWSRLSRSRKDWALAADRADLAGGRIESATEPNDPTAAGRFARGVMTELAAFESERIGEQWKEAHDRRRRNGLPGDGHPRFGYERQDDGTYTPDPVTSGVLARMYRDYLSGRGFMGIARDLNAEGFTTSRGVEWSSKTVLGVLDAGFGAGMIVHRPGRVSKRPDRVIYHPGAHEAVITPDEWQKYLARRAEAVTGQRYTEPKYMLTSLIVCGDCGSPMHVDGSGKHDDYRCSRRDRGPSHRPMAIRRRLVEEAVRAEIADLAGDVESIARAELSLRERRVRAINGQAAIDARLKKLDERMARLTLRWVDGDLPESAYNATVAQLDRERTSLASRRAVQEEDSRIELDVRRIAIRLDELWEAMTTTERNSMLRQVIARVVIVPPTRPGTGVSRDRVQIRWAWETGDSE